MTEDIGFRVLAVGNEPDFRTISEFRRIHLKALDGLFEQVLRTALELGAMKLGRVAINGTKMKANASKHKAMSYRRRVEEEKRLQEEAQRLLAEAEQAGTDEDKRYGRTRRGEELPVELGRREERRKRIAATRRALEQCACAEAEEKQKADGSGTSKPGGTRRPRVRKSSRSPMRSITLRIQNHGS